jgi:UDP-glucose 4-epimerase
MSLRILITGDKSYIGINLKKWLSKWPDKYKIDSITLKDDSWQKIDFSCYDVLFHVAAIVHKKEKHGMMDLYNRINRDLAIKVAEKAKKSGVKQFVFMSSMSVYGLEGKIGEDIIINMETPCKPNTFYGKSKLEAEKELEKFSDETFRVAIVRAPMIYGPDCPGNYSRLRNIVMKVSIFPFIHNQRSMLFIDNLCEFLRLLINNEDSGLFFPQNKEYVSTNNLVNLIAEQHHKKIVFSRFIGIPILFWGKHIGILNKLLGSLTFDMNLSSYRDFEYCVVNLENSVEICENKKRKQV